MKTPEHPGHAAHNSAEENPLPAEIPEVQFSGTVNFDIKDKVFLVLGGTEFGYEIVQKCLASEAKAVSVLDNTDAARKQIETLMASYPIKLNYIHVDQTVRPDMDNAFAATVERYGNLDVVINAKSVFDDLDYEKSLRINLMGAFHALQFGVFYISEHKSGDTGLVLTISSLAGLETNPGVPIFGASKMAIIAASRSFGHSAYFNDTKVRVVAVAPGLTDSPSLLDFSSNCLSPNYAKLYANLTKNDIIQSVNYLLDSTFNIIQKAETGTVWVVKDNCLCYEYKFP